MINAIVLIIIIFDAVFQESIAVVGKNSTEVNAEAENIFIERIKKNCTDYKEEDRDAILEDGYFMNNDGWEYHLTHPEVKEV